MLRREQNRRLQLKQEREREDIVEQHGVPEEHFLRKKRLDEFLHTSESNKKQQKDRRLHIVQKLLREEKVKRQVKRKHAPLSDQTLTTTSKKKKRRSLTAPLGGKEEEEEVDQVVEGKDKVEKREGAGLSDDSMSDTEMLAECKQVLRDKALTNIVEPEIRGLWDKTPALKLRPSSADTVGGGELQEASSTDTQHGVARRKASKAELRILKKAMEKLKSSKVQEQVAAGKKFKASSTT